MLATAIISTILFKYGVDITSWYFKYIPWWVRAFLLITGILFFIYSLVTAIKPKRK